jgi:hypothetical protein
MSFPGAPMIRIGHWAKSLPYPVSVFLPPTGPDLRDQIRTTGPYLDIAAPQDQTRHEKLGIFMDAWSLLEHTLEMILCHLTAVEGKDASLMVPKFGMKNALDLLEGLGRRKLDMESAERLEGYLARIRKLTTKRNVLIHGRWILEINLIVRRGEAHRLSQFLREVTPDDPEDAKAMANPRNQKARVRYAFTIKRIEAVARDTDTLNREICDFLPLMKSRDYSISEVLQRLSEKRPYQVNCPIPLGRPALFQANP